MPHALQNKLLRLGQSKLAPVALLFVLAVAIGLAIWWYRSAVDVVQPPVAQANYSQDDLRLAVEAVAAAEDGAYARAIELWQQLNEVVSDDQDIRLNQAVTVLKWIDETNNLLSSGKITDQAQQAKVEGELDAAYLKADEVITELSQLESADYRATLLQSALLEAKSRRLQYPADVELRKQAAQVLRDALSANPAQPFLACKFDELVQEVATQGDGLAEVNANALFASWKAQPRNLYLLARAAETLLRNEDERLLELLDPSLELTRPMLGLVASSLGRVNPAELVASVKQAVSEGDWRAAGRLRLWLNLFKAMSFNSDRRLVQPDVMALLDTSFLSRIAAEVATESTPTPGLPNYRLVDLEASAKAVAWYDTDLDLSFELVSVNANSLSLYRRDEQSLFRLDQTFDLGFDATGLLVADLYEVDDPNRPRVTASVVELMQGANQVDLNSPGGATPAEQTAADVIASRRHDTLQELVVWGDERVALIGMQVDEQQRLEFYLLPGESGLEEIRGVTAAVPVDIESDGDLDLVFATNRGIRILQNNGNRTFQDISEYSQLDAVPQGEPEFHTLVAVDYDADLDQDVLGVARQSKSILLLENLLHGQFRLRELTGSQWPELDRATGLSVADLDGNASWDWVASSAASVTSVTTRTPEPGTVVPLLVSSVDLPAGEIAALDLNNDGFQDLLVGTTNGLRAFAGGASGGVGNVPQAVGSLNQSITKVTAADCNRDGWLDIALIENGNLKVLLAESGDNHYLAVRVRGINDSNGGGRINHFAVGSTLEIWSGGRRQSRVVEAPVSNFGLGANAADNLRIIFPNGLTQNLEKPTSDTLIEEIQELKGSCPFIYGWNGEELELITDLLWNAPLGLQIARGQVLPDRRWEYLLLPGELLQPRDGAYELRVTEELWEVAYFDHMQLTAVDHPADVAVFTNEKVGPPELAEPKLFAVAERIELKAASDSQGRDSTELLQRRDGKYSQPFQQLYCQGLTEPHFVELDFGLLSAEQPLKLVLTGWLYPTDTSLNIGISQNAQLSPPEPPSLWVVDIDGTWVCAQPFMGFPGGKPKSIVVDLEGVFRSQDHRIRIASSQQIYWDEAFVASDSSPEGLIQQPLALASAQLRYRGFSQLLPREPDQPHWYSYQETNQQPKWPLLEGPFTRFGDVHELLSRDDNRMVVMTSGDEIVLRFEIPNLGSPNGWKRDFVLHSTGWDKDADLNTMAGQGSLPLPFAEQLSYPAPPEQAHQVKEVLKRNADHLTRESQISVSELGRANSQANDYN